MWGTTAWLAKPTSLCGVTLANAPGKLSRVALRLNCLARPRVPSVVVAGQDALVGKQDRCAGGVEVVTRVHAGPDVAGKTADVSDNQDVVRTPCGSHHLGEVCCASDGPAGVGHLPHESSVDEAQALDRPVLLLSLGVRSEGVELAGR
jgi:hypothetical protein